MNDVINLHGVKKVFTIGVVAATILWSIGIAAVVPLAAEGAAGTISDGGLIAIGDNIKSPDSSAVYNKISATEVSVFPNVKTWDGWNSPKNGKSDFSSVRTVTNDLLASYVVKGAVLYKPGSYFLKRTISPKTFFVNEKGVLHELASEDEAKQVSKEVYGDENFATRVHDYPEVYWGSYTVGALYGAAGVKAGDVAKKAYTVAVNQGGSPTTPGTTPTPVTQGATSATLERSGFATNANVTGVSVFDESGKQHGATGTSWSDLNTMTIDFSADPIKVPGKLFVKANLATGSMTGNLVIKLNSIGGVTAAATLASDNPAATTLASGTAFNPILAVSLASASTSSGLPLVSNTHSLVDGSNTIGTFTLDTVQKHNNGTSDVTAVSVNLGTTDQEITTFRVATGANEVIRLGKFTLYNNGSAADGDVKNITLVAPDGKKFIASQTTSKSVTFDLGGYELAKSASTKDFKLYVDLVGGSTRTVRFLAQNDYDLMGTGASSGATILPTTAGGGNDTAFPIGDRSGSNYVNMITISAGTLSLSKASDSPTGNVAPGATGVVLARWEVKPNGEAFEIRQIQYNVTRSAATNFAGTFYIRAKKADGTTSTLYSVAGSSLTYGAATTVTATFATLEAGKTHYIEAVVDVLSTAADALTYSVQLDITSAKRLLTNDITDPSVTAVTANTMTVRAGTLTVTANSGATAPNVVSGQATLETLGTWDFTAGAGEAMNISSIVIDDNTAGLGRNFKDFEVWIDGSKRSQDTSSTASPSATTQTITFNLAPSYTVAASQSAVVMVKARLLSSPSDAGSTVILAIDASGITGTGTTSQAALSSIPSADVNGQTITLSTAGTLVASRDTVTNVKASQLVAGTTSVTFGAYKLQTGNIEAVKVKKITVRNIGSNTNGITNIGLYNGTTLLNDDATTTANEGLLKASLGGDSAVLGNDTKSVTFDFSARPFEIAKNTSVVLTVKANTVYASTSAETVQFVIDSIDAEGSGSAVRIYATLTTENADTSSARAYAVGEIGFMSDGTAGNMRVSPVTTAIASSATMDGTGAVFGAVDLVQGSAATTYQVTMARAVQNGSTLESEAASTSATFAYNVGDVWAINDADAVGNTTAHIVTTAVAVGGTLTGAGTPFVGLTLTASDRLTRIPSGFAETTLATAATAYNLGDILVVSDNDTVANNGFYTVTNAIAVGGDMTAAATVASQVVQLQSGAALVTGDYVAKMPTLHTEVVSASATYAYSIGDIVVVDDDSTPSNNGAYVVETAVAAGATLVGDALGIGITFTTSDRISKSASTSGGAQEDSLKRLYPTKLNFAWATPASTTLTTGNQVEVARFTLGADAANANNPGASVAVTGLNFTSLATARLTRIMLNDVTQGVDVTATNGANSTNFSSSAAGGVLSTLTFQQGESRTFKILADVATNAGSQGAQFRFNSGSHTTAGTGTWSVTNNAVTSNSTWTVLAGDVADLTSSTLTAAATGSDTAAPTVIIASSGGSANNSLIDETFTVTFNERPDPITINASLAFGGSVASVAATATGGIVSPVAGALDVTITGIAQLTGNTASDQSATNGTVTLALAAYSACTTSCVLTITPTGYSAWHATPATGDAGAQTVAATTYAVRDTAGNLVTATGSTSTGLTDL